MVVVGLLLHVADVSYPVSLHLLFPIVLNVRDRYPMLGAAPGDGHGGGDHSAVDPHNTGGLIQRVCSGSLLDSIAGH